MIWIVRVHTQYSRLRADAERDIDETLSVDAQNAKTARGLASADVARRWQHAYYGARIIRTEIIGDPVDGSQSPAAQKITT